MTMALRTPPTAQVDPASNGHRPGTGEKPQQAATVAPPPKLRRRPMLIALGVTLIALGGVTAAWLTTVVGQTQPVLVLRADVDRGTIIESADLTVARIGVDPAVTPVPEGERDQVVGQHAAQDLAAGSLLTPGSVTDQVIPAAGESLVGVTVTRAQLPARPVRPGDVVRVVSTPRAQDDPPAGEPGTLKAVVVGSRVLADTGQVVVDVRVPARDAADLAARVATGRVALVLDGDT
jgi:hypothetical protein